MRSLTDKFLPTSPDLRVLALAEQISRDYVEIIKAEVVPEIFETYALKLREIRVLMLLGQLNEPRSAAQLAETLRQDPATITRSSLSLIGARFLYTSDNPDDNRIKNLNLTQKGQIAAAKCIQLFEQAISDLQGISDKDEKIANRDTETDILSAMESQTRQMLRISRRQKKM